jgi:prophage regulatory protein
MSTVDVAPVTEPEPLLITAHELARLLNISTRSLWRLRSAGDIPSPVRLGSSVRWRIDDVTKWIADGCPKPLDDDRWRKG